MTDSCKVINENSQVIKDLTAERKSLTEKCPQNEETNKGLRDQLKILTDQK